MNTKILFIALVLILVSSCQQRLSISKKYHSFGWNIALESKQEKTEKSLIPTKRKKKEQIVSESITKKEELAEEISNFSNLKNNDELKAFEPMVFNKPTNELNTQNVKSYQNDDSKKSPTLLKNRLIKKVEKKKVNKSNESGALKTLGWIFIILGIVFILIINILLGFVLCLLGLLFILVGK